MRRSTAVMVVRQTSDGPEVLLVERAPQLRFFGGYFAMPGGVVDKDEGPGEDPLLNCVHRELFEETGILVPELREAVGADARSIREELLDGNAAPWHELLSRCPAPATAQLCDITTPPFAPVRHSTPFYYLELPEGEEPDIWPGELVGHRFFRPADALAEWRQGDIPIAPPVLLLLRCLDESDGHEDFLRRVTETTDAMKAGALHPVYFTPGILVAPLLTRTKPPATTTNTCVVGEETMYVIDPSPTEESERERLYERLDEFKAAGSEIAGVLLTHYHPDHSGAAAATCARFGIPLIAHPDTLSRLPSEGEERREIRGGDELALGRAPDGSPDWTLHAVDTTGHAPGHLIFYESCYRAAVVGDMISTVSSILIDPAEGHLRTYLDSLQTMRDLKLGTIHPGHGPADRNADALIARTMKHRAEREEKIVAALSSEARDLETLLASAYDDVDERVMDLARLSLEAGLIKLVEDGRAVENESAWSLA